MGSLIGIDEAGRGSVLGPLIISLCLCERRYEKKLNGLVKTDSKHMTRMERERIYDALKNFCVFRIVEVSAEELNILMDTMSLNDIEAKKMAQLAKNVNGDIMIDLPDRYSWIFNRRMETFGLTKFQAQHKADENYPIVGAASVYAKLIRDSRIDEIKENLGIDFGSGYPSDEKTREALRNYKNELKPYIRFKWKTLETIKQTKLFDYSEPRK